MSQPRFLIVHGCVQQGVSAPEWPTGEDPFAVRNRADGCWFSWRVLGGNNRELGRGATIHATERECLSAMAQIQAGAERSTLFIGLRPTGLWWWQLELDGVPVAVSGRSYHRQRECRYNLEQFRSAWSAALIPEPSEQADHEWHPGGCVLPLRHRQAAAVDLSRTGPRRLRLAR